VRAMLAPQWRDALLAVPRHEFIPDTVWREDERCDDINDLIPLRREDDPETWLQLAYADEAVITQVDDGEPVGTRADRPRHLQLGMVVCEIGTGSGYNAALLAARLGAHQVTTIEVDPRIAGRAKDALATAGFGRVAVVTGDGAQGYPANAPYDRILSTAAVSEVPYAWIAQTRPGGRIVTPWDTPYYNGALLTFTVGQDGTAKGRLVGPASFTMLRDCTPIGLRGTTTFASPSASACRDAGTSTAPRVATQTKACCGSSIPGRAPGRACATCRTSPPIHTRYASSAPACSGPRWRRPTGSGSQPASPPSTVGGSPSRRKGSRSALHPANDLETSVNRALLIP